MSSWYKVTLTTRQRISLGQGSERAFLTRTHPFVPGSALRGALAAAWVRDGGSRDASFVDVFERGRFSPSFPAGVAVVPQSVLRCKYHSPQDPQHGLFLDQAFDDEAPTRPAAHNGTRRGAETPRCGGYERLSGGYDSRGITTALQTTTAILPGKHVAEEGKLFSREALEAGTTLRGWIVLDQPAPSALTSISVAYVGGRRSIQAATDVRIELADTPAVGEGDAVLRTLSPTILVDAAGRPSRDVKAALAGYDLEIDDASPGRAMPSPWAGRVVTEGLGGWHAASGLPKPADIGLAPGVTFIVRRPDQAALARLLDNGLGLRRSEGFGWLDVARCAWAPPAEQEPERRATSDGERSALTESQQEVMALKLGPLQRQWLVVTLQAVPQGGQHAAEAALMEPGAGRMSSVQKARVLALLVAAPARERKSLASWIKRQGTLT